MTIRKVLLCSFIGVALSIPVTLWAEKPKPPKPLRPVASAFTFEIGRQSALDTYLTPIRYWGLDVALGYERLRAASFAPEKWFTRHNVLVNYATMSNQSGSGSMMSLYLDYSFAMLRRWRLLDGLWVAGGGEAALTLGGLYNLRNSNNPATAKLAVDLGATAMASYHLRLGRLPLTFRYQVSLPVIGTYFSPAFGQSYYEMFYIGNRSGIVQFGAWHNRVDLRNYLSVDLHLGKMALRLGYRQLMRTTHVNHIDTQVLNHMFVLGISGEIFRTAPPAKRVVSVYY
ncbi:DUF3316 domain-containing protein [Barnesiella sp. An55]|uniref:DUF3316 domain-containing protein n=1 Tax=Barnesiella sp. An55 TaxID=1965646 RepID=UPI000B37DB9E|nr:DUF3316 domain-containing protein [Barnesiella sp. An55]OUN73438.1 hypothetical protein B5G10_04660 [Barnesiella sp. An55]HIZ25896.1 DUF3316 domain-containing protein [Candidatus Barnesiella merdipullorum]